MTTKTGTVKDALGELARLMSRRLDHVSQLAECDIRIEQLRAQIATVINADPIPQPAIEGPIPFERSIKLALLPGPLSAATVARRIRQSEHVVRGALRMMQVDGRVQNVGQQRGRNSRWLLTGAEARA